MSALDIKLHQLMWSGREYRLDELYRLTGSDKTMKIKSFRTRMAERHHIYKKDGIKYRCVAITLPAPCEIRKKIKSWLNSWRKT